MQDFKKIISDNKFFFGCTFLFILAGAVLLMIIETGDAIFYFSDRRQPMIDQFFVFVTKIGEEGIYFLGLVVFLFVRYRYALLFPITALVVLVVSFVSKLFFYHDRPLVFFGKARLLDSINFVEGVHVVTGPTSFPSGHTMSAFAVFAIIAFIIPKKKIWGVLLFVIALLVGISRIYLVQHFYKDIYLGAIMGVFLAMLIFYVQSLKKEDPNHWLDQSILTKKSKPPPTEIAKP